MWVDSICINQESIEEKNHQVRMMWRIYRSAARVWIWIGDYSHTVDKTLETFNNAVKLHGDEAQ